MNAPVRCTHGALGASLMDCRKCEQTELAALRAENETKSREQEQERELHLAEIAMLKKEVERWKAFRSHDIRTIEFISGVADRKEKELSDLRHDLDCVVQRETDLLNENIALQAAMVEWQDGATRVAEEYLYHCQNDSERKRVMEIAADLRNLPAPSIERGREIVRDAARYKWLREESSSTLIGAYEWVDRDGRQQRAYLGFHELDAAIDAAREKSNG